MITTLGQKTRCAFQFIQSTTRATTQKKVKVHIYPHVCHTSIDIFTIILGNLVHEVIVGIIHSRIVTAAMLEVCNVVTV